MSQQLISRSPDLKKLRDQGYEIEIRGGYLIIHHIPYVNSSGKIQLGKLISTLTLNNNVTMTPDSHVISFMGEHPCNKDGTIITAIQHGTMHQILFDGIIVNHSFSNKPPEGYRDYFEKVTQYVEIISAPARSIDPKVTAKTFNVVVDIEDKGNFAYIDSNSSRANIFRLSSKFESQRIGIIGLGGTGSYILDFVAKTSVDEIQLFDGDLFLQHNAFRSPGAPSMETLQSQLKKVDYFHSIYSKMHNGIKKHSVYVTEQNASLLKGLTFCFICIDSNSQRGKILSLLKELQIPFIDVGLGVNMADDSLVGTLRMTLGTVDKLDHIPSRIGFEDSADNEYATNIQIAELNALNALMAIMKWKKTIGFYQDLKQEHNTTYTINTGQLLHGDFAA